MFRHPEKTGIVVIAGAPGRDVPTGTLSAVLKAAGLKAEDR